MPLRVAIVDDEPVVCKRLSQALAKEGYTVEAFVSARSFLEAMIELPFDVVFSDMLLPDMNGLELLPKGKIGIEIDKIRGKDEVKRIIEELGGK